MKPGRLYRHTSNDASVMLCISASKPGSAPWSADFAMQDVVVLMLWHDVDDSVRSTFTTTYVVADHYVEATT